MFFSLEISAKNENFGYLNPILGKLGVMHHLDWWLVGKPMVDFLFALIELSSIAIYYGSGAMRRNVQLRCFRRKVDLFPLKFYLES